MIIIYYNQYYYNLQKIFKNNYKLIKEKINYWYINNSKFYILKMLFSKLVLLSSSLAGVGGYMFMKRESKYKKIYNDLSFDLIP